MVRHYLLTTFRHLWKRRVYSFISLLSLVLGMTVFSLIFLHVKRDFSYNRVWPDSAEVYRMLRTQEGASLIAVGTSATFSAGELANLDSYLEPYIEARTEISSLSSQIEGRDPDTRIMVGLADPGYLNIFKPRVLSGDLAKALSQPGFIAIEEQTAEELFGRGQPVLGETLRLEGQRLNVGGNIEITQAQTTGFEIAAVYRLPEPLTRSTSFQGLTMAEGPARNLFPSLGTNLMMSTSSWLKLAPGVSPDEVNLQLLGFVDQYGTRFNDPRYTGVGKLSDIYQFTIEPLHGLYFDSLAREFPSGDLVRTMTFAAVGLLVLIAGTSNAISLGLASALERRREIGIRKAIGALPHSIMGQYLGEALVLALLALVPTLILVRLMHPAFANLLSIQSLPGMGLSEYLYLLAIAVLTGCVAGLYPALVLARVKPVSVLKTQSVQPRMSRVNLRSVLVGAQFALSVMLLVGTLGLYTQLTLTRNQALGFDAENLVIATFNPINGSISNLPVTAMVDALGKVPGITDVKNVPRIPATGAATNVNFSSFTVLKDTQQEEGPKVRLQMSGAGEFSFLGIPVLAGREFDEARDDEASISVLANTVREAPPSPVVINRSMQRSLGYSTPEEAIGERIYRNMAVGQMRMTSPLDIIGVVEDSMYTNPRMRPEGEVYLFNDSQVGRTLMFRYEPVIESELIDKVTQVWLETTGFEPGSLRFVDDLVDSVFAAELRESRLLLICAGLALSLSCVGLYGLVSISMRTRTKEIGVRKVLGGSTASVVLLFLTRYTRPLLLANLVAWPVAVYFVLQWIERFPYQLEKFWLLPICIGTTALVLWIAWFTVTLLTWKAASTRPVKSLRYE